LGFALAIAARTAVQQLAASAIPVFAEIRLDRAVMIFCVALSLVAPLIFGVLPALLSSRADRLNERGEVASRDTRYLRGMLIAAEVALSIVLVVGAVLLSVISNLLNLTSIISVYLNAAVQGFVIIAVAFLQRPRR